MPRNRRSWVFEINDFVNRLRSLLQGDAGKASDDIGVEEDERGFSPGLRYAK